MEDIDAPEAFEPVALVVGHGSVRTRTWLLVEPRGRRLDFHLPQDHAPAVLLVGPVKPYLASLCLLVRRRKGCWMGQQAHGDMEGFIVICALQVLSLGYLGFVAGPAAGKEKAK